MLGIILGCSLLLFGSVKAIAHDSINCEKCDKERDDRPTKETEKKKKKFCNVVYRTNPKCKLRS